MKDCEDFLKPVLRFIPLGEKKTKNNSTLIGNPDKKRPHCWIIKLFYPLVNGEISNLEKKIIIPEVYKNFLVNCHNGFDLFLGTLSLEGYRENYIRTVEEVNQQPFDIITSNTWERPKNSKEEYFFFGGYNWDGSLVYINTVDNCIYLCGRYDATPLHKWESFEQFLSAEVERICSLMNDDGTAINPDKSTLPVS